MTYSTRHYSTKQEKNISKRLKGRRVPNSGAPMFIAGDVKTDKFCIECKTATKEQKSFSIKREWIKQAQEEAFSQGKPYWAIAFNFGGENQSNNWYIIDEERFKDLMAFLQEDNCE